MAIRVRVRIHYSPSVALVLSALFLIAVALLVTLVWDPAGAAASGVDAPLTGASSLRQYYLTRTGYDGANATNACAAGYHMASLWEILDPSNLKYNTDLGLLEGDSGQGPTVWPGWVRTGVMPGVGALPGEGNCDGWTTDASGASGTLAGLSWCNTQDVHIWNAFTLPCDLVRPVWCVEDRLSILVYLPLVVR